MITENEQNGVKSQGDESLIPDVLVYRYSALIETALERRAYKVEHDISSEARAIAVALGRRTIGPREVVQLHMRVLEAKKRQARNTARVQAYLEEGRLLILEVMGYLTGFYRDLIIADLEQHNM